MIASLLSAAAVWLAVVQIPTSDAECNPRGPSPNVSAWSATVQSDSARVHFLKSRTEDSRCPAVDDVCEKRSFVVAGDNVLVWAREGEVSCAMYTSKRGGVTVGRLSDSALDFHGSGKVPTALDWAGHWVRDDQADLTIQFLPDGQLEIEGEASWGGHDPVRVENGGVHVGEIELTRVRLTGHAIHFVAGRGNSPPEPEAEFECVVDLQLREGKLQAKDNWQCGGMNVSFEGTYERVAP
ncbi:MAG: hypothetical protein ABI866_11400 [Dokdonella sp.]